MASNRLRLPGISAAHIPRIGRRRPPFFAIVLRAASEIIGALRGEAPVVRERPCSHLLCGWSSGVSNIRRACPSRGGSSGFRQAVTPIGTISHGADPLPSAEETTEATTASRKLSASSLHSQAPAAPFACSFRFQLRFACGCPRRCSLGFHAQGVRSRCSLSLLAKSYLLRGEAIGMGLPSDSAI